jgi:hypothetical protein
MSRLVKFWRSFVGMPSDSPNTDSTDHPFDEPSYGRLQAGVTGKDLLDAITRSGYPFQAEVADCLRIQISEHGNRLAIQEEWAYIDSDSGQPRSLDVFAESSLWHHRSEDSRHLKVKPYLNLLVECKQSELPFVFFLRTQSSTENSRFPEIAGVSSEDLRIFSYGEEVSQQKFSFYMSLHDAMNAFDLDFCEAPAPFAISLAKVLRKSGKLELTGEETYRSLTLPLMKAADHFKKQCAPKADQTSFTLRFIICLAVVKAPMIGAYLHRGKHVLMSVPWVRTCRLEPSSEYASSIGSNARYFDVVHYDSLSDYISMLIRDLSILADRVIENHEPIASGVGISAMSEDYEKLHPLPEEYKQYLDQEVLARIARLGGRLEFHLPDPQELEDGDIMHITRADSKGPSI